MSDPSIPPEGEKTPTEAELRAVPSSITPVESERALGSAPEPVQAARLEPPSRWALGRGAQLILITAAFTLIAMVALWPVPLELDRRVIGGGELGGWIWRYWLMKLELKALVAERLGPLALFLNMISLGRFPETGNIADLYFISLPLELLLGHPAYYNVKCGLIIVLNGLSGYWMARQLTPSRALSFLGGCVLAVNSLVALELYGSGLRQAILWFLALSVGGLERTLKSLKLRDGLLTGLFFGLTAGFYWFYAIFLGIYALGRGLYALVGVRSREGLLGLLRPMVVLVGLAGVIAWVFAYPYLYVQTDHTGALPEVQWFRPFPTLEELQQAPLRPQTLEENLLASLARVMHSSWTLDFLWNPAHARNVPLVLGLTAVVLGLLRLRREWFFLGMVVFFWLHTGGPFLMTETGPQGAHYTLVEGAPVRLPYAYTFQFVPMMSRLFAPYRSAGMLWVLLALLMVRNLEGLRPHFAERRGYFVFLVSLLGLAYLGQIFGDRSLALRLEPMQAHAGRGFPVASGGMEIHPFYTLLAQEEGKLGVIELPLNIQQDLVNYYQVVHEKKLFRGWAVPGVLPPPLRHRRQSVEPATQQLMWLVEPDTPMENSFARALDRLGQSPYVIEDYDVADRDELGRRGFKYVILHERGCYLLLPDRGAELYGALKRRLSKHVGEGVEFVELISPEDPEFGKVQAGVLGEWVSSALSGQAQRKTRFLMTVYRMPGYGE